MTSSLADRRRNQSDIYSPALDWSLRREGRAQRRRGLVAATPAYIGRSTACPWAQTPDGARVTGLVITAVGAASAGRPARQVRAAAGGVAAGPGPGPVGTVSPEGGSEAAGRAGGSEGRTWRGGRAGGALVCPEGAIPACVGRGGRARGRGLRRRPGCGGRSPRGLVAPPRASRRPGVPALTLPPACLEVSPAPGAGSSPQGQPPRR